MRHQKAGRKLGRTPAHRRALYRNLVSALVREGRIRTTTAKAKEIRRVADRLVTFAKRVPQSEIDAAGSDAERARLAGVRVHYVRQARKWVADRDLLHSLFHEYGPLFADRSGGYTRVVKVGFRPGDDAPMSIIEFVERPGMATAVPAADDDEVEVAADEASTEVVEADANDGSPDASDAE
jgi:large subunit ribosomal protein L17